jgi:hypothetical protein
MLHSLDVNLYHRTAITSKISKETNNQMRNKIYDDVGTLLNSIETNDRKTQNS